MFLYLNLVDCLLQARVFYFSASNKNTPYEPILSDSTNTQPTILFHL